MRLGGRRSRADRPTGSSRWRSARWAALASVAISVPVLTPSLEASAHPAPVASHPASQLTARLIWQHTIPGSPIFYSSPNVARLDGTGRSVVVGTRSGLIEAYHLSDGSPVPGWPVQTGAPVDSSPSVAAIDGSGLDTVFVGSGNGPTSVPPNVRGGYFAFAPNGHRLWYQPGAWPLSPDAAVNSSLAVGSVTSANHPDVVGGELGQEIYALDGTSGATLPGWPYPTADSVQSSPALVDLPGGGGTDVVIGGDQTAGLGNNRVYYAGGTLRALNGAGRELWRFRTNEVIDSSPAVGDLFHNGGQEIAFGTGQYYATTKGGTSDSTKLFVVSSTGSLLWSANLGGYTLPSPALADLSGNGQLDVIEGTVNGPGTGKVWAFSPSGHVLPGFPVQPMGAGSQIVGQVSTADLLGNGKQDILVPGDGVYAYDGNGQLLAHIGGGLIGVQNAPLVTQDSNGTLGITLAGFDQNNLSVGVVQHYELSGGTIGSGAWPQFRHDARLTGNMNPPPLPAYVPPPKAASVAAAPSGQGYWIATPQGGVLNRGGATWYGSPLSQYHGPTASAVVGIAATPDGKGYYVTTASGAVYPYGDARWQGSATHVRLPSPVVGIATSGSGYLLVTARGNVLNYGTAWRGSVANLPVPGSIVGIASEGGGYVLASSVGNVFNFGTPWRGSVAGLHVPFPVVGVAAEGNGYLLLGQHGSVYNFSAVWHGSAAASQVGDARALAVSPSGNGYWILGSDGAVFSCGVPYGGGAN